VSELADHKVENPQDVVKVGDEIEVKILRVDTDERKIGLSLKRAQWAAEEGTPSESPDGVKRRGGLEGESSLGDLAAKLLSTTRPAEETEQTQTPERPKREDATVDPAKADEIALDALKEEDKPKE
jgi:small subunit ribosomal protein S1